jgi:hypothetical protein
MTPKNRLLTRQEAATLVAMIDKPPKPNKQRLDAANAQAVGFYTEPSS